MWCMMQAVAGMHSPQVAWIDGKPDNVLCSGDVNSATMQITACDFGSSVTLVNGETGKARHRLTVLLPVLLIVLTLP